MAAMHTQDDGDGGGIIQDFAAAAVACVLLNKKHISDVRTLAA